MLVSFFHVLQIPSRSKGAFENSNAFLNHFTMQFRVCFNFLKKNVFVESMCVHFDINFVRIFFLQQHGRQNIKKSTTIS